MTQLQQRTQLRTTIPLNDRAWTELLTDIRKRRDEFTAQRHVTQDIIERFRDLGVYRHFVANNFGGDAGSPADFCRIVEKISEADPSTGWVASFGVGAAYLAALPQSTLRTIYADGPDVVFAGGIFPLQPVRRTSEGLLVNGRWKYASASMGASLIGVGITIEGEDTGGLPRVAVMPAGKVRIEENWDVIGLEGTGSHDVVVEDVVVPEEWSMIRGGKPSADSPLGHYPSLALASQVLAIVGLGAARAALNEVVELSGGQRSIIGAPRLADRPYVQSEYAKAEIMLRSARSFFYEATESAWDQALSGKQVSVEAATLLRLAATNAARTGAEVSRLAFGLVGTSAIQRGHPLARTLADSLVVAQHAFLGEGTLQSAGRILLGLPAAPGFP